MTKLYNISPGFLITYQAYAGKEKLDMEEVFKRLSFELGGDGKTINKKALDEYIAKADSGGIKVDKHKLKALKDIQKNWDEISQGKDNITYEDIKKYPTLLAQTLMGDFTEIELPDKKPPEENEKADEVSISDAIYDYLMDYLDLDNKDEIKKSDLENYLNELVTNSTEENDTNSELTGELIGALTNMIATYSPTSTVEAEA